MLFSNEKIDEEKDLDKKMHGNRDRYCDIPTYFKSQIKLKEGADKKFDEYSGYINACYLNSPFSMEKSSQFGDGKIIASQGPLP